MNIQSIPQPIRSAIKWPLLNIIYSIFYFPICIKWQFLRKFIFHSIGYKKNCLLLSNVGNERFVIASTDRVIGLSVFASGEFDFDKFERAIKILGANAGGRSLTLLIDVGANIGTVCIPAVARGYTKSAIAIEPAQSNCNLLRANVALNGLDFAIEVRQSALDETGGKLLELALSSDNHGDHRIRANDHTVALEQRPRAIEVVSSQTLDEIALPVDNALIWMDVQGHEGHVLAGATAWLATGVPICLEFWPYALRRSNSYDRLKTALQGYYGFYDLNGEQVLHPIEELDELFASMILASQSTDLLFVASFS